MTANNPSKAFGRIFAPREDWLALARQEEILEPELAIIDTQIRKYLLQLIICNRANILIRRNGTYFIFGVIELKGLKSKFFNVIAKNNLKAPGLGKTARKTAATTKKLGNFVCGKYYTHGEPCKNAVLKSLNALDASNLEL